MHNEEENIRKLLGDKKPENDFKLPDNYFDTFSSKVKESIAAKSAPKKGFAWGTLLRPVYRLPVAAIVIIVAGYFALQPSSQTKNTPPIVEQTTTDEITTDEIEEYLAQDISLVGMDDEAEKDLMQLAFAPQETAKAPTATPKNESTVLDSSTKELSADDIEEYLLNTEDEVFFESL